MRKALFGIAALLTASAGQADTLFFGTGNAGDIGTNTKVYTSGPNSVTATGCSNFTFNSGNACTPDNLYEKDEGVTENGLGLATGDPQGNFEIWYGFGQTFPTILLNVTGIVTPTAQFQMSSTTANEEWLLAGFNGTTWVQLLTGFDESAHDLPGLNTTYHQYAFLSFGTLNGETRTNGNVLLSALILPSVPEPATWAMMLMGFGAIGFAMRRKRRPAVAQLA